MTRRIAVIQGHPDPRGRHFCHAVADAYVMGAREAGHEVETIDVARLEFPLVRSREDFEHGAVPDAIREAQDVLRRWASPPSFHNARR
jgi:putative NADPH-quinone reductase